MPADPNGPRPKLDPRLELFFRISDVAHGEFTRLRQLKTREDDALRFLHGELKDARAALKAASNDTETRAAHKELKAVEGRYFAPITSGLHFPDDPVEFRMWRTSFGVPFVSAFIVSSASQEDLTALGVVIRSQIGDIFTALIPLARVPALEDLASVRQIELARLLVPSVTVQKTPLQFTGIEALNTSGLTGAGTIIGVIDNWLDLRHPDFLDASGTASRVLAYWDQTADVVKGAVGFGAEYSNSEITAALGGGAVWVPALPQDGHGTLVTGIAAGNGRTKAAGVAYPGAAPDAEIVFVRCKDLEGAGILAESTALVDAFDYIFKIADGPPKKPCVVNLSHNDNIGPHDGTSPTDLAFAGMLGHAGRAITVSAGNLNNTGKHTDRSAAGLVIHDGGPVLELTISGAATRSDMVEIWYDHDDEYEVTVVSPAVGAPAAPVTIGPFSLGKPLTFTPVIPHVSVGVRTDAPTWINADHRVRIVFLVEGNASIPLGDWLIKLDPVHVLKGTFDAYVDVSNGAHAQWKHPVEDQKTVAEPATGPAPITVGNHGFDLPAHPNSPRKHPETGHGPTRDGRVKPEIATVGVDVRGPWPTNLSASGISSSLDGTGTSFAAPLAAGACALLFDAQLCGPGAYCDDLRTALTTQAGHTTAIGTIADPSRAYGHGYMQLDPIWTLHVGHIDTDTWLKEDADDFGFRPYGGPIIWWNKDIRLLDERRKPQLNPTPHPLKPFANQIEITVRNRGKRKAKDVDVFLYWSLAGTDLPFPDAWSSDGIFTGSARKPVAGNRIRVAKVAADSSEVVRFGWGPEVRSADPTAPDHFAFLVRVECEGDPSQIASGGRVVFGAQNNMAVRNVLARTLDRSGAASMAFAVTAHPADRRVTGLSVVARVPHGEVRVSMPIDALPWRDLALLERHGGRLPAYGERAERRPAITLARPLLADDVRARTDVVGAQRLELRDRTAVLVVGGDRRLVIPDLRIAPGARMPVRIDVDGARIDGPGCFVHAAQTCGAGRTGGVTLELRAPDA
ncbi:MAG TPA: S8 family serine peptidase [Planctomycetota bacterium]|jgi:hypothetical protein|nr:S8 family serine peptidase [Planctomycetota bacterium]